MKRYSLIMIVCFLCSSCVNELDEIATPMNQQPEPLNLTDGVIIGEKLQNPYSLEVMKRACDLLYPPTRGEDPVSDSLIVPNVKYVRFLPADSTEFRLLSESKLELFNYPLDYDILGDPSDYHDPNLPPEQITWQYTVMPIEQTPPINSVEILGVGFIPDTSESDGRIDFEAIEKTANGLVINTMQKEPLAGVVVGSGSSSSSSTTTSSTTTYLDSITGKIKIYDTTDGRTKGVKGVKVRARHFWKIRTSYTNEDGKYSIKKRDFDGVNPRFELRFENEYGFKLGYNVELIMPQTFNMGSTHSYTFRHSDDERSWYKAWVLGTINNAAYDWYKRCENEGMPTPPSNLHIWAMEISSGAACPMLNHGTYNTSGLSIATLLTFIFGPDFGLITNAWASILVNAICPDIFILNVDDYKTFELYEYTCHELAHATHFQQVGEDVLDRAMWWADVINYEVACGLLNGGSPYEHPSVKRDEKAGITEMWAHAVGHIMEYEHYGRTLSNHPDKGRYWFKPEIIWELYKQGLSLKDISQSLTEDIITLQSFKEQLLKDNANYTSTINSIYVF